MLLLVLLQVWDALNAFSLLFVANQTILCQRETVTHVLQLICKLLVFRRKRLTKTNKKKRKLKTKQNWLNFHTYCVKSTT